MKKFLLSTAVASIAAGAAFADGHAKEVKIGVMMAFTGPLDSLAPPIADGAELAIQEVNDSGLFMDGATVTPVRGDGTCEFAAEAVTAAERLVTAEGIDGLVGAMCSGTTGAVLTNVSIPNGILQISPSATSPGLSTLEDNGLFFRLAPSDARQGEIMSDILMEKGIGSVAVTYTNNDYGTGLADSFVAAFEAAGGEVTLSSAHDEGKGDYSSEIGELDAAGGDLLVVAGYVDGGGSGIIQAALDLGSFDTFVLPDGMVSPTIEENFGDLLDGSFGQFPTAPAEAADASALYVEMAAEAGFDGESVYAKEGYDSAAVMLLAMAAAGTTNGAEAAAKVFDVANAPGEQIFPGELAKGLEILAAGGEIDYVGASAVELIGAGEAGGTYQEIMVEGGKITNVGIR